MADFVPYEKTHRLHKLVMTVTIVGFGQAEAVLNLLREQESALMLVTHGSGTSKTFYQTTGGEIKKQVIFAVMREDKWSQYKKAINARFQVSRLAKGIAFSVPISTVFGVSTYKMLSNNRLIEKPIKGKDGRKHGNE